jgi:MFS family permease
MNPDLLRILDIAFFVFHTAVIVINLVGWIFPATRKLHRAVLAVTAFSWFGLGPLLGYPIGYCFCTDWHWQIRRALGFDDTGGYIQLLFRMAGLPIAGETANVLAYGALGLATLATLIIWLVERRKRTLQT